MADNTKREAEQAFFVFVRDSVTNAIKRIAIPGDVQIGLLGNPAELQLLGRLSLATVAFSTTAENAGVHNASNNDTVISVSLATSPSSGRITVNLPSSPRNGQLHFIKDVTGTATSTPVDVSPPSGVTIDGVTTKTISAAYGTLAVYWHGDSWRVLVSSSGGSGAFTGKDEGTSLGSSFDAINFIGAGVSAAANGTTLDVTVPGGAAGSGADVSASYVTMGNTGSLPNERKLTAVSGVLLTDGGAGGNATLAVDFNTVAARSGTSFTGGVQFFAALTGALHQLVDNRSYIAGGIGVSVVSASNGQIVIKNSLGTAPVADSFFIVAGNQVVDQVVFQAIGAVEFNPDGPDTMAPSGAVAYSAYFQPIVEVFPTGVTLEAQLYNVGLSSYVVGSLLSSSNLAATRLRSSNLSGSLATGSNTYEMHMRITNAGAGKAICKGAKLFVTWT